MKKLIIVFVVVVLGFYILDKFRDEKTTSGSENEIIIGGINPLTGEATPYGIMTQNVVNMRVKEINESGGINEKMLEVIWEDGKCTPGDASKAVQKLIGIDKVSVIIGGMCSGEVLGAAPIMESREVVFLSLGATSPEITHAGDFIFRTSPSDSSQGKVLGEYASKHFEKIGLMHEQTDYALGIANAFEENFEGEIVREIFLSTESDFKTRITKLKNAGLDAFVFIPQTPSKFEIFVKQFQEQNLEMPLLLNDVASGNSEVVEKYTKFFTQNKTIGANFIAPESSSLTTLMTKYEEMFGEKPVYMNYAATSDDAIRVLEKVLREVEDTTNSHMIRDALYATQDFDSLFGTLAFDENGDVNITHTLLKFEDGSFVTLEE